LQFSFFQYQFVIIKKGKMNTYKHRKLSQKMLWPLICLGILGALLTWITVKKTFDNITQEVLPEERAIGQVRVNVHDLIGEYREYDNSPGPAVLEEIAEIKLELHDSLSSLSILTGIEPPVLEI
jgi:hypothetical protein